MLNPEIQLSELRQLLENDESGDVLDTYFVLNPQSWQYELKKEVVIINDEIRDLEMTRKGGHTPPSIVRLANTIARFFRNRKYRGRIKDNPDQLRIVSEGDSWFQHPSPKVKDTIDHLCEEYAIYSLGAAMDEFRAITQKSEYKDAIAKEQPDFFLISGGGNDILGENMRIYIQSSSMNLSPGQSPERFVTSIFYKEVETLIAMYDQLFNDLQANYPSLKIITHGYDYVRPVDTTISKDASWIGKYMTQKGIKHIKDKKAIVKLMIDEFNGKLSNLISDFPQVYYVDVRGKVEDNQWHDEIHPNNDGFEIVSNGFAEIIESTRILN